MDGIHDMGGKQGYGPIIFSEKEARGEYDPFPGDASRGWSVTMTASLGVENPEGRFRFARECIPPALYLERPYTDQWIMTTLALMIDGGSLTPHEIETGRAKSKFEGEPPMSADRVPTIFRKPYGSDRPAKTSPTFNVGETVRARLTISDGHSRLPGFVRGHQGTIYAYRGAHVYQDESAHFRGEHGMHLYTVRFENAELWPESQDSKDAVYVDLWEAHLENT